MSNSVRAFRHQHDDFGVAQSPILIAVRVTEPQGILTPARLAGLQALAAHLRADPEVNEVESPSDVLTAPTVNAGAVQALTGRALNARLNLAVLTVTGRSEYATAPNLELIRRIRQRIVPAVPELNDATVLVGGGAAPYYDFSAAIFARFGWVVAIILAFSYPFLFWAFRSVFVPLKAVLLNLLALAASFGLLQLVFQRGLGATLIGIEPESGIASWVPVFPFAFLFGLSADYEIFLLSRIREAFLQTRSNRQSVAFGLGKTGVLITSAAAIMVFVFASFIAGHIIQLKETGFGLAAAIFLDASLIRALLVPAIMNLMGDWNWWAPRALGGLPRRQPSPREEVA